MSYTRVDGPVTFETSNPYLERWAELERETTMAIREGLLPGSEIMPEEIIIPVTRANLGWSPISPSPSPAPPSEPMGMAAGVSGLVGLFMLALLVLGKNK